MPFACALVLWLMAQTVIHAAPDEIDGWARSFNPLNLNGTTPHFDLPENTPIEQIVAAVAQEEKRADSTGQFHKYRIVETKKIDQPDSPLCGYTVVLIASDKGSKTMIVLDYPATHWKMYVVQGGENTLKHMGWTAHCFFITTVP